MPDDVGEPGASTVPDLVLPHGAKPLRRRVAWGVGVGVLVEHHEPNFWGKHAHERWQVDVQFSPAVCEINWTTPEGSNETRKVTGNQVWFMPPGWVHSIGWLTAADVIGLYVEPKFLPSDFPKQCPGFTVAPLTDFVSANPQIADHCAELRQLCREPEDAVIWRMAGAGSHLAALLADAQILLATDGLMPHQGLANQILKKLHDHVEGHGSERIPIRELAQKLGFSPRHFRRIVSQITGKSPQELVSLWKTQHAKSLLESGTHNVSEAATAAGFSDPAHLNRRMQSIYGVSPKAFLPRLPRPFRA